MVFDSEVSYSTCYQRCDSIYYLHSLGGGNSTSYEKIDKSVTWSSQNFTNSSILTHASTHDLHAEMIALKSFVVDQLCMPKKKSDEKQILSNNENKALMNNLIDQIEFLLHIYWRNP